MCGITGIYAPGERGPGWAASLAAMTDALEHRGPDDRGSWVDDEVGLALGHRRLSVIDLSAAGRQPMPSSSGRFRVTYNGEIYNFRDLRAELENAGRRFRTGTDTEVLLEAAEEWGVERAVERCVGMFAFALWDRVQQDLWLARDRLGEKPLSYGWFESDGGPVLLFGSELSALRAHPAFDGELDRDALALYLRLNYLPAPHSIHRRVHKLPAAHLMRIGRDRPTAATPRRYWNLDDLAAAPRVAMSDEDALERLDDLLSRSSLEKTIADVPVGAFLSGGVDSTLAVALLRRRLDLPVRTFTIGFETPKHDESTLARETSRLLGTDHTDLVVTPGEMLAVVPKLPAIYDEPFADPAQIPTYLVSRLARQHVTVGIAGDGGDELFAGYDRYASTPRRFLRHGLFPAWARDRRARSVVRRGEHARGGRRKSLECAAQLRGAGDFRAYYKARMSDWFEPGAVVLGAEEARSALDRGPAGVARGDRLSWMLASDLETYLPDGLMTKTDRASMAVSLEVRGPFLDHRLVEFAFSLPDRFKLRDGVDKWLPRRLLERYVPREITERPKHGFLVPMAEWLRTDLRDWAEDLLGERRLREEGVFDPTPIRRRWEEHLAGVENWNYSLFSVLSFQAWRAAQRPLVAR